MNGYEPADVFYPVPKGPAPETLGMRPPSQAGPAPPVGPILGPNRVGGRGLLVPGNIDINNRPRHVNPDGSASTVRSMSFGSGGREVLVPTVGESGQMMTDDQAIDAYRRTGRHLGQFDTPDNATSYAQRLHGQQAISLEPFGSRAVNTGDVERQRSEAYALIAANPASEEAHAAREVLARLPKIPVGRGTGAMEPTDEPDHTMMVAQYMRGMR